MRTAPLSAGSDLARPVRWHRRVHFGEEVPAGVPILQNAGIAGLNLVVEVAWGAVLTADPATWQWFDVTRDVMTAGGKNVSITLGKTDEASLAQPAHCSFMLDNRSGVYSKGGQSINYPNVKINTPVRVRTIYQNVSTIRFYGYSVGFDPDWDHTGNYAVVSVKAEGALRRIQLGKKPIQSALRRSIPSRTSVVAYWPCEDGPLANQLSVVRGGTTASIVPVTTPAAFSGFASSAPIPTVGTGGGWNGFVALYPQTGTNVVRFIGQVPATGIADVTSIAGIGITGTGVATVLLVYGTLAGGSLALYFYDASGALITTTAFITFAINGELLRFSIEFVNSGSNVNWAVAIYQVNAPIASVGSGTVNNINVNAVNGVSISTFGAASGFSAGHVTVENTFTSLYDLSPQQNAFVGENASNRMTRLSSENNVPLTQIFDGLGHTASYNMGAQPIDTYINCIRECEAVDQGLLCDGLNNGLTYFIRYDKTSIASSMTLDASAGDMAMPFTPLDDDLLMRNRQVVTLKGAGDYIAQDDTSAFSVANVGMYDQSATINFADNKYDDPFHLANWLVHVGTSSMQVGYRYPKLELDFARRPAQIPAWLSTPLWGRVDINNLNTARSQAQLGPVQLLVEGWTETISQFRWNAAVNASPYEPWRVVVLANQTGDTGEFICHLDTDGCVVTSPVAAGASSFAVTITGITPWTTASDDFPFQVDVAGVPITVTAISALSGSSQTFTVTGATVLNSIAAGTSVSVWRETTLGY